jgi:hypothetical protein
LLSAWKGVWRFFLPYLGKVRAYSVKRWTREKLSMVRVPPAVDFPRCQDYPPLGQYIFTEADDPADPRNAHKEQSVLNLSDYPLTLGFHNGDYVIGDGLHRAKTFLVASAPTNIPVYVPVPVGTARGRL